MSVMFQSPWSQGLAVLGREAAQYRGKSGKLIDPLRYKKAIEEIDRYVALAKQSHPEYFYNPQEQRIMDNAVGYEMFTSSINLIRSLNAEA